MIECSVQCITPMRALFLQFILLFLFVFTARAQTNLQSEMKEAERLFNQKKYDAAKSKLKGILKESADFATAIRLLGLVELKTGKFAESAAAYEKLFVVKADLSRNAYYEAAEAYLKQYKYDKALEFFLLYKHSQQKDYKTEEFFAQKDYDKNIDFNIANCEFSLESDFIGQLDQPTAMKGNINSDADEFMPTIDASGKLLLFTSVRDGNENILIAKKNKEGEWTNARSIGNAINTKDNEGMAKFTTCGRRIYFSACAWENVKGGCDVYMAEYDAKNDVIDKVEPANGLNSEFWDSQPTISCDGNTMYFVSNREGGIGGTDIWRSKLSANGVWGEPENLGTTINTEGDEETPFIAPDGITLYFSSTGHPGMGEADLFMTVLKEDGISWSTPLNLGETINSPFREAGLVISAEGRAYFASARSGKGSLDLYENHLIGTFKPRIDAVLLDAFVIDDETQKPLEGATVRVRSSNKSIGNFTTDKDGRFFICVPSGASYSYIIEKPGFDSNVNADYFEKIEGENSKRVEIFMTKGGKTKETVLVEPTAEDTVTTPEITEIIAAIDSAKVESPYAQLLNKIDWNKFRESTPRTRIRKNLSLYFDVDTMGINDIHKEAILKMIAQHEDPFSLDVQITGFADDDGDEKFNNYVSVMRAKSVADFMMLIGMTTDQVTFEGKGKQTSNMAKHQNRRVEIIVTD